MQPSRITVVHLELLQFLKSAKILNQPNSNIVHSHKKPERLCEAVSSLFEDGILTNETFQLVAREVDSNYIADALCWLNEQDLLTSVNTKILAENKNLLEVSNVICLLHISSNLMQKTFDVVVKHDRPQLLICDRVGAYDLASVWENILEAARNPIPNKVLISKLKALIQQEALQYLSTLASPSTTKEAAEFNAFMRALDTGKMILLWPHIKEAVGDSFFKEFHSLFESKQDSRFIAYIDTAQSIFSKCPRVGTSDTLQKQFSESNGYRQSMYQVFRLSATFFSATQDVIERRHDNSYMQELYDRQFGLVLR